MLGTLRNVWKETPMATSTQFRLPTNVRPVSYDLTLTPDLEQFTFIGNESIEIDIVEATDSVTLNAADLEIAGAELVLDDGAELPSTVVIDKETERAAFQFGQTIAPGKATLRIRFTGTLNDQLRGFYRSQYDGPDGETRHLATAAPFPAGTSPPPRRPSGLPS
jgi:aminopeptidase N